MKPDRLEYGARYPGLLPVVEEAGPRSHRSFDASQSSRSSSPARRVGAVKKIAISFRDQGDRFVVLSTKDRCQYRFPECLRKLILMVAAEDGWRLHEHKAFPNR